MKKLRTYKRMSAGVKSRSIRAYGKKPLVLLLAVAIVLLSSTVSIRATADTVQAGTGTGAVSQNKLRQTILADGTIVLDAFKVGSRCTFTEQATEGAGDYALTINYINGTGKARSLNLYVNGVKSKTLKLEPSASAATTRALTTTVSYQSGANTVAIQYDRENFDPAVCPPSDEEGAATAETVARSIRSIQAPRANATKLLLPVVPDGFTITLASSSNTGAIGADGALHFISAAQTTQVAFTVTDLDGKKANTQPMEVVVPAEESYADAIGSTGPMYWIGYESPFQDDSYLTEDRWDSNVDWMAKNFVPYGYNMMSTDGWIEGGQEIDQNGYVTKYNPSWKKGWKDMADQLATKGMKLGVYYDPLWMTAAAYNSDDLIEGTNIPVKSLVNPNLGYFSTFNNKNLPTGSAFSDTSIYAPGKTALYWIDTDLPGAEQYIKGYVQHFAEDGVVFLRTDFLGWYENGIGGDGMQNGKPAYGTERYAKALKWMREACDQYGVTLSLVMPNQYNHAQTELQYGNMMRVDEDVANGGWDNDTQLNGWPQNHISGRRRGVWQPDWAQWGNVFDALTGWSDVGGRGQITLDADFLRLNRFDEDSSLDYNQNPGTAITQEDKTLLDAQKRSTVSLFAVGGSPLCIASQYDTINQDNQTGIDNATYLQNQEVLSLHQQGFIGKPIGLGESERWAGQLPDGSWVVGLFNRDHTPKVQSLDFLNDLGITGWANVHDMWKHQDLGLMTSYSVTLGACDSVLLKITPSTVRYQAETASLRGGAKSNDNHSNFSGFGFVDKLENQKGDVLFAAQTSAGSQNLLIRYSNGNAQDAVANLSLNGTIVAKNLALPSTGSWDTWGTLSVPLNFTGGDDIIDLADASTNGFNLDYFELGSAGPESVKPYYKVEAENSAIGSGAKADNNHQLASNGSFVDGLDSPWWMGSNDTVDFKVTVPQSGSYDLILRYANGTSSDATANINVNGTQVGYYTLPVVYPGAWDTWGKLTVTQGNEGYGSNPITLNAGTNDIIYEQGTSAVNLDCLTVVPHAAQTAMTAKQVADSITSIPAPAASAFRLDLPVQNGFTVSVAQSTPAGIIDSHGGIAAPKANTPVSLVLSVTNQSNTSDTAKTKSITVTVPGKQSGGSGSSSGSSSSGTGSSSGGNSTPSLPNGNALLKQIQQLLQQIWQALSHWFGH